MSVYNNRKIKHKNIFVVYSMMFLTFGIYPIVWSVKSKRDMNALGANIPSTWLMLLPMVNIYWLYRYCEGFAQNVAKDNATVKWFCVHMFFGIVTPYIIQSKLNEFAIVAPQKLVQTEPCVHVRAA